MRELKDRVAVITGAASGIGRATALELTEHGCRLALADVNEAGLAETRTMVQDRGGTATIHVVDVTDRERMQAFVVEVRDAHDRVHIVINNAGVASGATFDEQPLEDFERVMNVNFWGVVHGCKYFLPELKKAGEGHFVNISSVLGIIGVPQLSAYCASKFAVKGFSECLWLELREHNIGVTSIHPGLVKTNIAGSAVMSDGARKTGFADRFTSSMASEGADPGTVARAIVKGIRNNRVRVLTNRESKLVDPIKRMFPESMTRLIGAGYDRMRERINQ